MSSATTIGGITAAPMATASSIAFASMPAKKSIQAELSTTTTTTTQLVDVDLQVHLPLQRKDALHRGAPPDLFEPIHERFGDAFSSRRLCGFQQVRGEVRRDAA